MSAFIQNLKSIDDLIDYAPTLDKAQSFEVYYPSGNESKFKVIKNLTTDEEVCTISKRYSILQHSDAITHILSGIQGAGITGSGIVRNYGNNVVVETYFDNLTIRDHSQDGHIQLGLMFTNSFNKSIGFNAEIMGWRQVCQNGMLATKLVPNAPEIHFKHMGDVNRRISDAIKQTVEGLIKMEGSLLEIIDEARQEIIKFQGEENLIKFIAEKVGSERRAKQVIDIEHIELESSKWSLYNALTSYTSHTESLSYSQYKKLHEEAQKILLSPISNII